MLSSIDWIISLMVVVFVRMTRVSSRQVTTPLAQSAVSQNRHKHETISGRDRSPQDVLVAKHLCLSLHPANVKASISKIRHGNGLGVGTGSVQLMGTYGH